MQVMKVYIEPAHTFLKELITARMEHQSAHRFFEPTFLRFLNSKLFPFPRFSCHTKAKKPSPAILLWKEQKDSCLLLGYEHKVKYKQPHPGFEVSLSILSMTVIPHMRQFFVD